MTTRYSSAALRDLISAALTEDEFTALAFDYFRPVYEQFAAGQTLRQRVQLLIEHAERHGQTARLAALIQEINPARYGEFADRLLAPDGEADDAAQQGEYSIYIDSAQGVVIGDGAQGIQVFSDWPVATAGSSVIGGRDDVGSSAPLSPTEKASLLRQLAELRENLRLIEERKSQFVLETEIPLQLIKDERRLRERIAELDKDLDRTLDSEMKGDRLTMADDGHLAQRWQDLEMSDAKAEAAYRDLVAALDERLSFPLSGLSFNAMLEEVYKPLPIARARPDDVWRPTVRSQPDDWLELDEMLQADGPKALLGLLGEGKTTTLHYLNWAYARRPESQLFWHSDEIVPFYLTAGDLARARQEGGDLVSICAGVVARRLGHPHLHTALVQRVLQSALNTGNALILVDALDEHRASDAERSALLEWLAGVWRTKPFQDNQLLLTSRPYAFLQVGFQAYALQPPEASQAGNLAYRLGRALLRDQGVTDAEQQKRLRDLTALMRSPQMRDFTSPFYITLLTLAICRSSHFGEGLAQARAIGRLADLYHFFLRQTIHWEREKLEAPEVDEDTVYLALAELGWQTFVEPSWRDRLVTDLLPAGDRRQALAFWQRTGLLQKDAFTGEWHFYHTGFQLFGVALMLNEAWKRGQQATIKDLHEQAGHLTDWDTIWELFFGLRGGEGGRRDSE